MSGLLFLMNSVSTSKAVIARFNILEKRTNLDDVNIVNKSLVKWPNFD
jgi:hypothetical protein